MKLNQSFKQISGLLKDKKSQLFARDKVKPKRRKLNLSNREFILVAALIIVVEIYVLAHYWIIPKWQKINAQNVHYHSQQMVLNNLIKDMENKDTFDEELKLLDYKLNTLKEELPANLVQEDILLNVNKVAGDRKLTIKGITFTNVATVSKQDFAAGKTTSASAQNTGNNNAASPAPAPAPTPASTSPAPASPSPNSGNSAAPNAPGMILVDDINISFAGSYESLYNFISDLEKSNRRILIKGITIAKGDNNTLTGELAVEYLGYKDPDDQGNYQMETPQIKGKFNIFAAFSGAANAAPAAPASSPAPAKTSPPSFYLILNTYDDNAPKVIIGDFTKDGTELYSNTNDTINGKLTVSGGEGHFSYTYALGKTSQSKQENLLLDGGKLRLDVISQHHKNSEDKVGIDFAIENKTDYPLVVNVINDDKDNPRFKMTNSSGSVTVNR